MTAKRFCLLALFSSCLFLNAGCFILPSEQLNTLSEQGKQEELKSQALEEDEARFEEVRSAIADGRLETGTPSREIARQYGDPVVVMPKETGESWLYNARHKSFFSAPKIYLYFDPDGRLARWECVHTDCGAAGTNA